MKIPKFLDDLSVISKLGDNPGADNGLTAEGLKAKFDEAGLKLQTFLNETLIEKINSLFSLDAPPHEGMNMTGPINMNKNKLGGLADPTDGGDAVNLKFANENYRAADWMPTADQVGSAPMDYAKKVGNPYNLLDNSDFRNPVNQRGNGYVTAKSSYPIDRWVYSYDGDTSRGGAGYDATRNYVYLLNNADSTGNTMLFQKIPADKLKEGKYTIAFHQAGTVVNLTMLAYANGGIVKSTTSVPNADSIALMSFELTQIQTELTIYLYAGPGKTIAMDWAALYEGEYTADTLPVYQPKGYALELAACNVADAGNPSGGKVLWENASPLSSFVSQTIAIDEMRKYNSIMIVLNATNGDNFFHFAHRDAAVTLSSTPSSTRQDNSTPYTSYRAIGVYFTDGTINFGNGYQNETERNDRAIPVAVIGLY